MDEVDGRPESGTFAIEPAEPAGVEDASSFDEGPDLAVIEALAEEDAAPARYSLEPPQPGPISMAPVLDAVTTMSEHLTRRLDALQVLLERDQRVEATRERVVNRLHAELQEYKQDLLLRVQRPIFVNLIQLHDDLGKMIEARAPVDADPERAAALRGTLESIQTAIEDILYRQGVEPYSVEGSVFDPRRQRAVSTTSTADPGQNKTIAARLRAGFQAGEKVIRPEIVSVYTVRQAPSAGSAAISPAPAGESEPSSLRTT